MHTKTNRFWEIDTLRGIAIIMMVIYHILFDLNFLNIYSINLHLLSFRLFLYPIGTTFLLLVGISLTLSYSKQKKQLTEKALFYRFIMRGMKIFTLGLLITVSTWFLIGDGFIVFGVLHLIGVSIILSYPFINEKTLSFIIGITIIPLGIFLRFVVFEFNYLLWLGFIPRDFYTLDYFPLFPWFGVVLLGIGIGNHFYKNHKRQFNITNHSDQWAIKNLSYLGRHSLIIYVLHQPIILFILIMITR